MGMRGLVIAAFVFCASAAHAEVLKVGERLAELDVGKDASGKAYKLKGLSGKWVVVTIGADWCKPCAKELPTWDKLAGQLAGKVTFVAIDIDNDPATGKRFHDKLKLRNMTRVYLPADKSAVAERYGADHMPTTFVANPDQIIKVVKDGFETGDADGELKKMKDQLDKLTSK
jgi:thiol-disulfide isomerase/thioredoxin